MTRNKLLKILITIQLLLFPFLDMLRTTSFKDIEFLNIAVIELVNIVLIGISLIITLTKVSKKKILLLLLYLLLVGIYIILHYQNIIKFDTNIYAGADFNFITETFYILRVYVLPIMLLYVLLNNRDIFNKEFYFKIIKWLIGIISFSIIILNILKLSYISYNDNSQRLTYNIFDYFLYSGDYKQLSSRGFFDSANELSAILFMLMPINIYMLYKEGKKINVVLYIAQYIAMVLLGTRTSAYGALLISITSLAIYGFLLLIKKEQSKPFFNKAFIISCLACTAFMTISPFMLGRQNEGVPDFSVKDQSAYDEIANVDLNDLDELIQKFNSEYLINEIFLEMYPVNNDPEFWLEMIGRDKALNNDSRQMKTDILERIYERNDNPNDKWLGLGYTLNFMDLERDYYYQFYILGIGGMLILMGPYFALLIYLIIKALKNFKYNLKFKTFLAFMSPVLGMVIAYFSGHVYGWVSPMMFLSITLSFTALIVYENSQNKKVTS